MAIEIKLPDLGENIESGTIAKILVSEGQTISQDQAILELETDKAVIEVPSEVDGKINKILVEEGAEVKVGQTIVVLDTDGKVKVEEAVEKISDSSGEQLQKSIKKTAPKVDKEKNQMEKKSEAKTSAVYEFKLPDLGESVESGTVAKILVEEGDKIGKDQNILELETEKAVVEVPSDVTGVVQKINVKEGDTVKVGQRVMSISVADTVTKSPTERKVDLKETISKENLIEEIESTVKKGIETEPQKPFETLRGVAPAAPSVRRFAREIGIDINDVAGGGPGGRISINDVKSYAKMINTQKIASKSVLKGMTAERLPDFSKWGEIKQQKMSKVRETTAKHLGAGWPAIPHVTQFDKADVTELEKLRKQYSKKVENQGGKLTVTAIILKIISGALKVFPQFNASINMEKNEIVFKSYVSIGVAVDTDRGLLVPVIREVDKKNIVDLSIELNQIAQKAREAKLSLEDMQGGNFTISNLGGIGGTSFSPVVNSPEVAILGISRSQIEPVYIEGQFTPRLMLPLSLSYDHRLIDGADGARFLRWVAESIEQPFKFILEG
jgi:pyruvate dehydrogenase E2 component (dihydrolipoamide acetyltransferase)